MWPHLCQPCYRGVVFVIDEYEVLAKGLPTMDNRGVEHQGTPEVCGVVCYLLTFYN